MNPHFEITDKAVIHDLLDRAEYGTLAVSAEEQPYAVPVNFVRVDESIYFHGALKNRKMSILMQNPVVSFSVVESYALIDSDFSSKEGLACPATQFFKSVSIEGSATVVEDREEKADALEALMKKLQPKGGYKPFSDTAYDKALKATAIVKIEIKEIRCKFKFGQHLSKDRFDMIIDHLLDRGTPIDKETARVMKKLKEVSDGV